MEFKIKYFRNGPTRAVRSPQVADGALIWETESSAPFAAITRAGAGFEIVQSNGLIYGVERRDGDAEQADDLRQIAESIREECEKVYRPKKEE